MTKALGALVLVALGAALVRADVYIEVGHALLRHRAEASWRGEVPPMRSQCEPDTLLVTPAVQRVPCGAAA